MDSRILIAIVALLVVLWLIRSRFLLHSQSQGNGKTPSHPQRRMDDRTLSGRWFQRSIERGKPDIESTQLQSAVNETSAGSDNPAPTASSSSGLPPRAQVDVEETARQPAQADNEGMQSEVDRLTDLLQQRERILARNRHAMEEVEKLKKKLFDKGREMEMLKQACARSDAALAHYRTRAQSIALLEQQLAEAQEKTGRKEQELSELRAQLQQQQESPKQPAKLQYIDDESTSVTEVIRRKNQISKKELARELRRVEKQAEHARQNSLELRRIRSELESVCADRASARNRIAELQVRVQAQQRTLETARSATEPSGEISALKQSLEDRQHQNEELRQQLARLSGSSPDSSSKVGNSDSSGQEKSIKDDEGR
ncbi:hypothetical protein ACUNV4_23965 [Granulosicoccus sp. 3-233]|uniref:hypothetical protein n=1 Tax=Granulosicoccus sp. 3-233 TaxID=3417969 RepID=UPI003D3499BC